MNLPQLSYWDQSFAMADVVRHSSFTNIAAPDGAQQDADGSPKGDFNLFFTSRPIGAGTYKLVFAGRAALRVDANPAGKIENQYYDAATNRTTADLVLPGGSTVNSWIEFRTTRRSASSTGNDGVTDLHLWRPGYPTDGSVVFTHEFIEAMRKVQILRAMDTTNTNDNATVHWSERTLPSFLGRAPKGQSWEMLIQLANATGRDLWINVPVKVDDDYITKLAQLFRYGSDGVQPYTSARTNPVYPPLRSDLKLYVEYGNELWNTAAAFYGYRWVIEMANAAGEPFPDFIARRSAFISQTFRGVWGDDAMMTKVRPVFSNQAGNGFSRLGGALRWAESNYGDGSASKIWWGGGGATYYDSTVQASDTQPATMQAYFDGLPDAQYAERIKVDAVLLKAYGLRFIAYEGGPQPGTGNKDASVANAYNTDPRMPERMAVAYDIFRANGGDMQVYYNYSGMGAPWWFIDGTKQLTVSDTTSPKMRFLDTLATRPVAPVTLGTSVPGTVYLRDPDAALQLYAGGSSTWGYSGTAYQLNDLKGSVKNEMLMAPVRTTVAGRYSVALTTLDANTSSRLEVFVNGVPVGEFIPSPSSPAKTPAISNVVTVDLPEGLSVIRLRARTGNTWVRDIVVQAAS